MLKSPFIDCRTNKFRQMNIYKDTYKIIFILLLLVSSSVVAQERFTVSGKVISSYNSAPVTDAMITFSDNEKVVQVDSLGQFAFEVVNKKGEIEAWAPGYYKLSRKISNDNILFVLIPENKANYNEVIVLPFGNEKLKKKASNSNNISRKDFAVGASTIGGAIQNYIPGLQVINKSGMAGEGELFGSRGTQSFISNSTPLIVINGVPYLPDYNESHVIKGYSQDVLKMFSVSDIKQITLLRGAEASLYGSLGANGVLMIQTDDATDLETSVEFFGQYGVANNANILPVLNNDDYKTHIGKIALTKYADMADVLENFPYLKDDEAYFYKYLYNNSTNWQQEIYRPAFVTDNSVKIKGGDAIAKYNLSFGYLNQQGVIDNTGMSRYNMKLNSNINVSAKIDLFASMSLAYYTIDLQEQGMHNETNPMLAAMRKSPLVHPFAKDENNNILPTYSVIRDANEDIVINNAVTNPVALINQSKIKSQANDVLMNGGINYRPNNNLQFTGMIGLYHNYNRENSFIPGLSTRTVMPLENGLANNTVRVGIGETFNLYYNLYGRYKYNLNDDNNFIFSAGLQSIITKREYDSGSGRNTSSDFYKTLDNVSSIGRSFDGYINQWNWLNYFASATYYYQDLLTSGINVSLDGSSASGPDATRYGLFPSVNVAVHTKSLDFINDVTLINKLDLRGEFNMSGNSNFSANISEYYYQNQVFRELSGIVRVGVPNTSLKWENYRNINLGLDLSMLNNKIDLIADFYSSTASDVIIGKTISSVFGFDSMLDNLATIRNNGVEVGLQAYLLYSKRFHWLMGGTFAANQNKIVSLGGEKEIITEMADGSALISKEGESVYSFYGYKTNGVYATTADAIGSNITDYAGNQFSAGDVIFENVNNSDNIIDKSDRTIIGNANPDFFGRFYTSLGYGQFTLNANFIYSYGNQAYNAVRREVESVKDFSNQSVNANKAWIYEGQITDVPRAVYGDPNKNNRFSDRWIEDASFIKLKELSLNYNFNSQFLKMFKGGDVYIVGENLFTLTNYLGLDPEFSYSYETMLRGYDLAKIPQSRSYKFGFRLQF